MYVYIYILLKIWEWTQEKLTNEEINNKVLLATDGVGMTAFLITASSETYIFC
jgi:hypothetical protein